METEISYRFRLYPNQEQESALIAQFGACRFVWNRFLRERIDFHASHTEGDGKRTLSYNDTCAVLTVLKRQDDFSWLKEANAQSLQQSLSDLDKAYNNFFARRAKFPKFKKRKGKQSFRVPQAFRIDGNRLIIPKVSPIRIVAHRQMLGELRSVTISMTPTGKFFASVLCRISLPQTDPVIKGKEIGVDLGLKSFAAISDGEKIEHPRHLLKAEKRLSRLQRRLSRRVKGSKGHNKARRAVALQYEKVANRRLDFLHKLSRRLVDENQIIHAEDLNVKGMLSNHRWAKRISDSGWAEFLRQLGYKSRWRNKKFLLVDRFFPSSKRCHICGWVNQELKLSDRE